MKVLAAFFALVIILGLAELEKSTGAEKLKFTSAIKTNPLFFLPPLAAEEKGFWKVEGLEAEWYPFTSGTALAQALAAGSVFIGTNTIAGVITAAARGLPLVIVADLKVRDRWFFWVLALSPIRTASDLKGAKVGVTRMGSLTHAYVAAVSKALGMEKNIKVVATGGLSQTVAAVKAGAVDTVLLGYLSLINLEHQGEVRGAVNLADFFPPQWNSNSIFAMKSFIERNPKEAGAAVRGLLKASGFLVDNPRWAIEKIKEETRWPQGVAEKAAEVAQFSREGKIDKTVIQGLRDFMMQYGLLSKEKAPAVEQLYDERFVRAG